MGDQGLNIGLHFAHIPSVTRRGIDLELRRDRQAGALWGRDEIAGTSAGKGRFIDGTQVPPGLRVGIGRCRRQVDPIGRPKVEVSLNAANAGIRAIVDFGEAVGPEVGELEALPFLLINRGICPQHAVQQCRFDAQLIVGQEVGCIGRDGRAAVDAAGAEAA